MNERIRELTAQTDVWCDQYWYGHQLYNQKWEEKFAELIIQECAETIQDFVDHRFPASEYPDRLKKYFGVE